MASNEDPQPTADSPPAKRRRGLGELTPRSITVFDAFMRHGITQEAQRDLLLIYRETDSSIPKDPTTLARRVRATAPIGVQFLGGTLIYKNIKKPWQFRDTWEAIKYKYFTGPTATQYVSNMRWSFQPQFDAKGHRVYSEPWTANQWGYNHRALHPASILHIVLCSDGVQDATRRTFHPVYVVPANLPIDLRSNPQHWLHVAWLPEFPSDSNDHTNAKRAMFHAAHSVLFEKVNTVARNGGECINGRYIVPVVHFTTYDHSQKITVCGCRKNYLSLEGCDKCHRKRADFGNIDLPPAAPRTSSESKADIAHARALLATNDKAGYADYLKEKGLIDMDICFHSFFMFCIHVGLLSDILHEADLGVFKTAVKDIIITISKHNKPLLSEVDATVAKFSQCTYGLVQRFQPNDWISDKGTAGKAKMDGKRFRSLMQLLPFAMLTSTAFDQIPRAKAIIQLLLDWLRYYLLLRKTTMTEADVQQLTKQGKAWHKQNVSLFGSLHKSKLATIKAHSLFVHLPEDIRQFGTPGNFTMQWGEQNHKRSVHQLVKRTNKHPEEMLSQMARRQQLIDASSALNAAQSRLCDDDSDSDSDSDDDEQSAALAGISSYIFILYESLFNFQFSVLMYYYFFFQLKCLFFDFILFYFWLSVLSCFD
jgi:hypothetical protein